jgi:DDE superfamily endonuclease/Helix-turn-helix of DDE superfamily endonuclease
MLTYDTLAHKPGAFKSMTGLTVQEFEELLADLRPRYEAARQEESVARPRRRAPGGGAKPRYALRERLLMTLVWLRLYLTCEAVGVLFAVDKSTVSRYTRPLLRLLRDHGQDTLGWPEEARALLDTAGEAGEADDTDDTDDMDGVAIIDATEQRVERARDDARQREHYSGKKKAHTRKTLIVVNEHGRLRYVSPSVPGATHDLTVLRQSGALEKIPPDLSLLGDSGFQGLQNDAPERSVALPYKGSRAHPLTPEQKLHNALLSRIRIVVENTLAEMKHFRILADVFRHPLDLYDSIFVSIAGLVTRRADRRLAAQGLADQSRAVLPVAA